MGKVGVEALGAVGLLFIGLFAAAWLIQRARLPAMVGLLLLGFALQGYAPSFLGPLLPLIREVAVWFLLFFLGLEYSPQNLAHLSRGIVWPGLLDLGLNFGGLFLVGLIWLRPWEALLLAIALYPSSTAIVARLLSDARRLANPEAEFLVGLLVFEDLVVVVLLAVLSPFVQGEPWTLPRLLKLAGGWIAALGLFFFLYRRGVPWMIRWMPTLDQDPLAVFLLTGLVLSIGGIGHALELSGAFLAFLLGVLVPEGTALYRAAEKNLLPLRELSVGLFFFGMTYGLRLTTPGLRVVGGLALAAFLLKGWSTFWGARIWGLQRRAALRAAFSFLPRGEFSVVWAALLRSWREELLFTVLLSIGAGVMLFYVAPTLAERFIARPSKGNAGRLRKPAT
ncbi:MAG: cation:proton antiporter [Bacteroidetes bacterium]|nr:MAG: cation:proton antiporter [Bacteroidota bacterium]